MRKTFKTSKYEVDEDVLFRLKANVKSDVISGKLVQGVTEESCQEGTEYQPATALK